MSYSTSVQVRSSGTRKTGIRATRIWDQALDRHEKLGMHSWNIAGLFCSYSQTAPNLTSNPTKGGFCVCFPDPQTHHCFWCKPKVQTPPNVSKALLRDASSKAGLLMVYLLMRWNMNLVLTLKSQLYFGGGGRGEGVLWPDPLISFSSFKVVF